MKNFDSVPAALEQAASLALQFTAAPRDYLGPATNAMKEQAALGERLAAAIRALHVTAAPAAAPQAAADERQAFENKFPGVCGHWNGQNYGDSRCQRMWEVWQSRADLAAAPVQAQEPANENEWLVANLMKSLRPIRDYAADIAGNIGVLGSPPRRVPDIEWVAFTEAANRMVRDYVACAAPVQPVAVPDGGRDAALAIVNDLRIWMSDKPAGPKQSVESLAAYIAAPAAQGDAKELTDERIYDIAASCEIGIGHNDHETSQRFEFARAILAAIAASKEAP